MPFNNLRPLVLLVGCLITAVLTSSCAFYYQENVCGNNTVEGDELCDGTDLAGEDCITISPIHTGGVLACDPNCQYWDTSECYTLIGQISGTISIGPDITCGDAPIDCYGTVFIGTYADDPGFIPDGAKDYSGEGKGIRDWSDYESEPYSLSYVPIGQWWLSGYLDEEHEGPETFPPTKGDPIIYPAHHVTVYEGETTTLDLVFTIRKP